MNPQENQPKYPTPQCSLYGGKEQQTEQIGKRQSTFFSKTSGQQQKEVTSKPQQLPTRDDVIVYDPGTQPLEEFLTEANLPKSRQPYSRVG